MKKVFAVIDTNVLVSALLTKNPDSAPSQVLQHIAEKNVVPLYNSEILSEYNEVLRRSKFSFPKDAVQIVMSAIEEYGIESDRTEIKGVEFPDPKDIVFYEVAMSQDGSFLVTGNLKHFPKAPIVVSPRELLDIIEKLQNDEKF